MKKYMFTAIGAVLALDVLLVTLIADIDLFEAAITFLDTFEEYEIDEFIIPLFIFLIFAFIDFMKSKTHKPTYPRPNYGVTCLTLFYKVPVIIERYNQWPDRMSPLIIK